jgi:hypothetical protein
MRSLEGRSEVFIWLGSGLSIWAFASRSRVAVPWCSCSG